MKSVRIVSITLCSLALATLLFSGCGSVEDPWKGKGNRPYVVTSFPPLYCFAKNVAKDGTAIVCLTAGRGPHHYEYTHADTLYLSEADLLLSNGLTLDGHFIDKMVANSGNPDLKAIKLGNKVPKKLLMKMAHHHHEEDEEHHHHHGEYDPHLWLGLSDGKGHDGPAIALVYQIRDALTEVDAANAELYKKNADAYVEKLRALQKEGEEKLKALSEKKTPIVTSHESLGYFQESFGLNVAGSIRLSDKVEVGSRKFKLLIDKCKALETKIITTEPQYNDAAAKTLKQELEKTGLKGIQLIMVDPLETATPSELDKEWYERKMRENIENLSKAKP